MQACMSQVITYAFQARAQSPRGLFLVSYMAAQ